MKKALTLLIAVMAFTFAIQAQSPVRWRISVRMTSATEGEILIKALISDGWHLYGLVMPKGGPKATSFDFSDSDGIALEGSICPSEAPIEQMDPLFGKKLSWWDRNVNFTQRFTLKERKDSCVKVAISYMSCNGGSCTPPKTETITTSIPEYNPAQLSVPSAK